MKRVWLKSAGWTVVTEINRQLCAQTSAQHGPTSDGHIVAGTAEPPEHEQFLLLVRQLAERGR